MHMMNRRELLVGAAAVAVTAKIPAATAAAKTVNVTPSWVVGTPGEFNWQHIVAKTAEQAERIFRAENECEGCTQEVVAERKPIWDGKDNLTSGDWLRAGMGTRCSRCGYETFPEENGHAVGDEAVCEECMTLADWNVVDPEHAAELRAEALTAR